MNITCIVFDYGGVISLPQNEGRIGKICSLLKTDRGTLDSVYAKMRHDFDAGRMDAEEYWKTVITALGKSDEISEHALRKIILHDFQSWLQVSRKTLSIIRKLSARGYTLAVLSNMTNDTLEYLRRNARWLKYFKHTVFSCELNRIKPEEGIYRELLGTLSAEPGQVIFIDDSPVNIDGAEKLGIHGIRFTGCADLIRDLNLLYGITV